VSSPSHGMESPTTLVLTGSMEVNLQVPGGVPPRLTVQATMSMVRDFMDSVLTLVPSQLSHLRSFRLSVSEIRLPAKMLSHLENPMSNPVNK